MRFITANIKGIGKLSTVQQERLAYVIVEESYQRAKVFIHKGETLGFLYMVVNGEACVRDEYHYEKFGSVKPLIRLGPGSIIGEE